MSFGWTVTPSVPVRKGEIAPTSRPHASSANVKPEDAARTIGFRTSQARTA